MQNIENITLSFEMAVWHFVKKKKRQMTRSDSREISVMVIGPTIKKLNGLSPPHSLE